MVTVSSCVYPAARVGVEFEPSLYENTSMRSPMLWAGTVKVVTPTAEPTREIAIRLLLPVNQGLWLSGESCQLGGRGWSWWKETWKLMRY